MNQSTDKFAHIKKNLTRISSQQSIFNYEPGKKAFLSLGQGNLNEWLEMLLPNTRLILEPKIIGSNVGIQYINGKLNKAINKSSVDKTEEVKSLINLPKRIAIKNRLEIQGVIFDNENKYNKKELCTRNKEFLTDFKEPKFCAFQIFHCKINHFQTLQELKNLNFEVPQTHFTKNTSDIEIYRQCWREGKLFNSYPTCGIVLKINSRKLQKSLGENSLAVNWAHTIN